MKLASEKKLQRHMIRFLMIDSQQTSFNTISQILESNHYIAQGKLLDDLASFEKALNLQWDVIIYNNAYDLDYKTALQLIEEKGKATPLILLSELENDHPEIIEAYQLGTYVVSSIKNFDFLTLNIYRASVYTRLVRREQQLSREIDSLQQQTQTLVETTEHAVAIFQEGVHVSANDQYIKTFGIKDVDDYLGLPLLDILQPENVQEFKQQFKRLSKGDFSQGNFTIKTLNPLSKETTLNLQFSATEFEDEPALQLVIISENVATPKGNFFTSLEQIHAQITTALIEKENVGLLTFNLESIPLGIFQQPWHYVSKYYKAVESRLLTTVVKKVFRLSEHMFVAIVPLDNEEQLNQMVQTVMQSLPKTAEVQGNIFTVDLSLGSTLLSGVVALDQINGLIIEAQQQKVLLSNHTPTPLFSLDESAPSLTVDTPVIAPEPVAVPQDTGLSLGEIIIDRESDAPTPFVSKPIIVDGSQNSLLEQIENNTVKLYFQQLYDKEDIDTHLYEVSASFTHEGSIIDLATYAGLNTNPELSIKLDRWILVEASKRLHQFLATCPKARVIVNMHSAIFTDNSLAMLLTKLVSLINSKYTKPLILQFNEEQILTDMENATQFIQSVQEYGIGVTVSNFGESNYSYTILNQLKLVYAKLSHQYSDYLLSDDGIIELQEKLDAYKETNPDTKFVLSELDDMNKFANAWNVDARYLQGSYFQAKQNEFVNNAS